MADLFGELFLLSPAIKSSKTKDTLKIHVLAMQSGGFCLSWIWMIVVLCKPNASAEMREESNGRAESTVSIGVSQPVFIAVLLTALAVSAAGVFVLVKFSWWGLAIVGVGLVIFAILHNKA